MKLDQVLNNHRQRYKRSPHIRETLKKIVEITERVLEEPRVKARPIKSTMEKLVEEQML